MRMGSIFGSLRLPGSCRFPKNWFVGRGLAPAARAAMKRKKEKGKRKKEK
jgi:hypothetical protein